MNLRQILVIGLAPLLCAASAKAELTWEQTELELRPSVSDKTAVGQFKYKNTGSAPIHINSVQTSCGCTVATLAKNDIAPGEKGEITATFNIGDRTGTQLKTVKVNTNDPSNPLTVLTLKAVIPALVEIQPAFVYWESTEPLKPKTISVKAAKDSRVSNVTVSSSDAFFETKVEPGSSPKEWIITISPKEISQPRVATLIIRPDYPVMPPKLFYASAKVLVTKSVGKSSQ